MYRIIKNPNDIRSFTYCYKSFAKFQTADNPLRIKTLQMQKKHKTQHLSMKNGAIFEIFVCKKVNSCNINALGSKKTSSYYQMTSSKSD